VLTVEEDEAGGREDSQRLQRFCLPLKHEHLFMPAGPDRLDQTATGAARRPVGAGVPRVNAAETMTAS
jgi:hypothetical protein